MIFEETKLKGSYLVRQELKEDERGFFSRCFCKKEFLEQGLNTQWMQINNSLSKEAGTLRGLHYQREPNAEVKLVRCLKGSVWDVIVDLRDGSKTFGKWFGSKLTEVNRRMMYVPKGFAHGFISLKPYSEIIYLASDYYEPNLEVTLHWNDPDIAIKWPIKPRIISKKDSSGLLLRVYKKLKS
jgi:dTDP-4-dehydrorhamnose 3,5-epimerase